MTARPPDQPSNHPADPTDPTDPTDPAVSSDPVGPSDPTDPSDRPSDEAPPSDGPADDLAGDSADDLVDDLVGAGGDAIEVERPALDRRVVVVAAVASVVVAVVLALMVDSRLDRQVATRTGMLLLTLLCVGVLAVRRRRSTRIIGVTGLVVWGLLAPTTLTTSAAPPEAKFALKVHDDAKAAMNREARSTITVEDVVAAVNHRGGGVGRLQTGQITGYADAFPLVIRPDKSQPRPRICLTIEHGTDAKIRRC